ncbi:MAG: GNAT family N-acetyltransferase [Terrimonas sp.]|nr:GNAT family N-acetyltransferase [Terrimonas sp.]
MLNKTFTPFPVLTTKRLTLRQLVPNDEEAIFNLRTDAEINRFLDRKKATSLHDARQFIDTVTKNTENNSAIYWAISFIGKRELIGTICLFCFSDDTNSCEIGYELLTGFQRQGIMQEAVHKVIDHAFHIMGVQKIEAIFHKNNLRSMQLLEKLAFRNRNEPGKKDPNLVCYYLNSPNA